MKGNFLILSWSVWVVYVSCLVLESVYYNVEMCMMWALVLLGSFCVPFTNSLMKFYFITIIINAKYMRTTGHCSLVSSTPSQSIGLVLGVRCSGVQCHLCSFSQSLEEALFHHDNYTTMYYIIWKEIFSFFPDRFELYISVAWFWNLYIIMWKCVWCALVCCWGHFVFLSPIPWWSSISSRQL